VNDLKFTTAGDYMTNKMNENIVALAERSGFCFWGDEAHNPGDVIDWACRYDDEFVAYTAALVREVLQLQAPGTDVLAHNGIEPTSKESLDINLSDEDFIGLAKLAHERDVTINKVVEDALWAAIKEHENESVQRSTED